MIFLEIVEFLNFRGITYFDNEIIPLIKALFVLIMVYFKW